MLVCDLGMSFHHSEPQFLHQFFIFQMGLQDLPTELLGKLKEIKCLMDQDHNRLPATMTLYPWTNSSDFQREKKAQGRGKKMHLTWDP